jgi:hypothetical protein
MYGISRLVLDSPRPTIIVYLLPHIPPSLKHVEVKADQQFSRQTLLHVHWNYSLDTFRPVIDPEMTRSFSVIINHTWCLRGTSRGAKVRSCNVWSDSACHFARFRMW